MVLISADDDTLEEVTPEAVIISDSKGEVLIVVSKMLTEVEKNVLITRSITVESLIITSEVDIAMLDEVKIVSLDGIVVILATGCDAVVIIAVVVTASKVLFVGKGVNAGEVKNEVPMAALELSATTTVESSTSEVDAPEPGKVRFVTALSPEFIKLDSSCAETATVDTVKV